MQTANESACSVIRLIFQAKIIQQNTSSLFVTVSDAIADEDLDVYWAYLFTTCR